MIRIAVAACVAMCGWPITACSQGEGPAPTSAAAAYRTGVYDVAARLANSALQRDSSDGAHAVLLIRALADVGQVQDAIAAGETLSKRENVRLRIAYRVGRAYESAGQLDQARDAYRRALNGPDAQNARYELARLSFESGNRAAAMAEFDTFLDLANASMPQLSGADLRAVALAIRMLGRQDPQLFKDALRAFDAAIARDTVELDTRVELAEMLLEKFNGPDAREALGSVLAVNPRHPRALLALARVESFDGTSAAAALLARALVTNPREPDVNAALAMQLIDVEKYAEAEAQAQRGLEVDSTAPAPWIAIAAARFLRGDVAGHEQAMAVAHRRLGGTAVVEVALAEVAARNRLYRQAVAFASAGVSRDDRSGRALALQGINQLRIGQMTDGASALQAAFAIDPYDVWVKNTLDLIDTFSQYTEIKTPRFTIAVETKDAALLELVAVPLAEEAYDSLASRYGFRPAPPVRVEFFRSHDDFAVRAVGLAGLGALGVSFGNVVAMDSPAARKVGDFNWGSTLWHELTHTFTLGVTDNKVPRWVSEGLSVYEERRARAGWGSDVSPQLIAAFELGRLRPLSSLNDGFMRPRYPEEVILSYALASYVFEMIEADHGIAGIRALLASFKQGRPAADAFRALTGMGTEALDGRFDNWFRTKFATEFGAVEPIKHEAKQGPETIEWGGPLRDALQAGASALAAKRFDAAVTALERARGLFPEFAGEGSAYHMLAEVYEARGDGAKRQDMLREIVQRNETSFAEHLALAEALSTRADSAGAARVLDAAVYIGPFVAALHTQLAERATSAKAHDLAIRSRQALVALQPSDRADAFYQLAKAYADAGRTTDARREVLRALDVAPNFERAQDLLLQLRTPEGP